jgi:hypothetical protein
VRLLQLRVKQDEFLQQLRTRPAKPAVHELIDLQDEGDAEVEAYGNPSPSP